MQSHARRKRARWGSHACTEQLKTNQTPTKSTTGLIEACFIIAKYDMAPHTGRARKEGFQPTDRLLKTYVVLARRHLAARNRHTAFTAARRAPRLHACRYGAPSAVATGALHVAWDRLPSGSLARQTSRSPPSLPGKARDMLCTVQRPRACLTNLVLGSNTGRAAGQERANFGGPALYEVAAASSSTG